MSVLTADMRWISVIFCSLVLSAYNYRGAMDGASLQGALSVPAVELKTREFPSLLRLVVVTLNINRCITGIRV